jgi:hypothetical protein
MTLQWKSRHSPSAFVLYCMIDCQFDHLAHIYPSSSPAHFASDNDGMGSMSAGLLVGISIGFVPPAGGVMLLLAKR